MSATLYRETASWFTKYFSDISEREMLEEAVRDWIDAPAGPCRDACRRYAAKLVAKAKRDRDDRRASLHAAYLRRVG